MRILKVAANSDGAVIKITSLEFWQQVQLQTHASSGSSFMMTVDIQILLQ
jgi:hypothetical protein